MTGYVPKKKGKKKKKQSNYRRKSTWNDSENVESDPEKDNQELDIIPSKVNQCIPIDELLERVNDEIIDYELIGKLVQHLVTTKVTGDNGSILIFLPGVFEISSAQISISNATKGMNTILLPLHGGLQSKDQQKVFHNAPQGHTKVILSTNVAETSITIPDCVVVIDTCKEKQSSYDPSNRMPLLLECFASKDSLKQRRGRAGRVREGFYYQLIRPNTYQKLSQQ